MQIAFKTMAKLRGAMVTIIYKNMLTVRAENANSSAALSLMSTDVDRITFTTFNIVNLGPSIVQLGIALGILGTQLGASCVAPVILCILCGVAAAYIGKLVPPRQRRWMAAIQKRVGITSDVIGSMKGVKVAGLSDKAETQIEGLRTYELDKSVSFRKTQVSTLLLSKRFCPDSRLLPRRRWLTRRRYHALSPDARRHFHRLRHRAEGVGQQQLWRCPSLHLAELAQRAHGTRHEPHWRLD